MTWFTVVSSGILMQWKKFLDFVWQIPHVQQKLISFTDPKISQLPNNDWCIQHSVKRFNLRLNLSHNVKKVINSTSNPEFQALFTVAQGFRPGHQWELLPDQPEELKTVGFGDTSCRNLGSYQLLYFAVAHTVLLKQVEQPFAPHGLFRTTGWLDLVIRVDGLRQLRSVGVLD